MKNKKYKKWISDYYSEEMFLKNNHYYLIRIVKDIGGARTYLFNISKYEYEIADRWSGLYSIDHYSEYDKFKKINIHLQGKELT